MEALGRTQNPVQRATNPEEVAKAVVFLASPEATMIVGATLPVDGGMCLAGAQPGKALVL